MRGSYFWTVMLFGLITSPPVHAFGPAGHRTVGFIAAKLIAGSRAAQEVKKILGNIGLSDAAVWADCAKGIDDARDYNYLAAGKFPECKIFETPQGETEMADFVRRNSINCAPPSGAESCHKQYHYTDVSITATQYRLGLAGTRNDDVVAAIAAAIHVLKNEPAPAPFQFKNKREALLLLTHYLGDIHQPLHVGAIYLDAKGQVVNPDRNGFDRATSTRGGNTLLVDDENLHALWDNIPASMARSHVNASWLAQAQTVAGTPGNLYSWPAQWATESLTQAQRAFRDVKFGPLVNDHWMTILPPGYSARMDAIKQTQLTAASAHLAELLRAIWP